MVKDTNKIFKEWLPYARLIISLTHMLGTFHPMHLCVFALPNFVYSLTVCSHQPDWEMEQVGLRFGCIRKAESWRRPNQLACKGSRRVISMSKVACEKFNQPTEISGFFENSPVPRPLETAGFQLFMWIPCSLSLAQKGASPLTEETPTRQSSVTRRSNVSVKRLFLLEEIWNSWWVFLGDVGFICWVYNKKRFFYVFLFFGMFDIVIVGFLRRPFFWGFSVLARLKGPVGAMVFANERRWK